LYERGLIYQGDYIINWCPRCQTALSDEEAAHKEIEGSLYHIRYPLEKAVGEVDHLVVATTRPETMLGDTAVAVNPKDTRYQHLIGKRAILPLVNRPIPIIADDFVDLDFGTGLVKVTPAHDPNDFAFQSRHPEIGLINILNPDGTVNENGGSYKGLDRFEARKQVVRDLESKELLVKRVSHLHAVGHCYRCHTIVEPYLSKQWFVKMKPMAEKALKAHREGKTKFVPERWNKVYLNWLEGIRDWCISRQIWWGHQIPVWYCECGKTIVSREDPTQCPHCKSKNLKRDPDVLDTWFSSWLWPFSTLGWPEKTKDLDYFYPTSVLVTAPEIIFFWVARMIMAGLEFTGEVPFHTIYIHGTVRTDTGQKMSKSLGNAIDPLTVIDEIGADALRFSIVMLTASGQDAYLSHEKFELGRNFTNKIWNASRFVISNFPSPSPLPLRGEDKGEGEGEKFKLSFSNLSLDDKWILTELQETIQKVTRSIEEFRFNDAATALYQFFWSAFCDWYIELTKPILNGEEGNLNRQATVRSVLALVLEQFFKMLHPFMPFLSEEIWNRLKEYIDDPSFEKSSIMLSNWPKPNPSFHFKEEAREVALFQEAVTGIRDIRARLGISPKEKLDVVITSHDSGTLKRVRQFESQITHLTNIVRIEWVDRVKKGAGMIGKVFADMEIFVTGVPQANLNQEQEKTKKKIGELEAYTKSLGDKLANQNFTARAPEEIVADMREKKEAAEKELLAHRENLAMLQGGGN
ncbi:MAG: valine--tRNA ligase, partial [Candidatus Omnitrophica bacterium]|nr:valine--tRNA ligase [Candidatus Omnitrophota bacterium]